MTDRALGGYEFNQEIARIKNSVQVIRIALARLIENPGPQTIYMLAAKMAVEVTTILDAINNIEDIGQKAKGNRK